ncbi:MAG: acetaldehyde dehydrogenase (acetylating), partial [Actinomycetia bacterium]|nr:acetaldehyde dehydrogenase (acetylating) [Actinomycetes bacterium]
MNKIKVAIIGPGNIGSDLMAKINKSKNMEMALMVGIRESDNIKRVRAQGVPVTIGGVQDLVTHPEIQIVFDATSASAHLAAAPILAEAGMIALDLTPAAVGPYLVPAVNFESLKDAINVNLVTCGGQATIPIVYAVSRVAGAKYAEIVACISSPSAGPGTRQSIDEFTQTTAKAVVQVGGADRGKAIIILNPAEPPIIMINTIYVQV